MGLVTFCFVAATGDHLRSHLLSLNDCREKWRWIFYFACSRLLKAVIGLNTIW